VVFLTCEQCVRLWAEYRLASQVKQETGAPDVTVAMEAILKQIETHEAEVHKPASQT
jgi:hypothetical protein